jgi:Protein of unknown function (DUF3037)
MVTETNETAADVRPLAYRVLRYTPNLVRDEFVNIGVLVFDPESGERRLRLIEERDEYVRVRRLHPKADEALLRALRNDLEDRFASASDLFRGNGQAHEEGNGRADWLKLLGKWDDTLSNALQLAPQKGTFANDLDAETDRLYADHVALERGAARVGAPGSRATMRLYCQQVFQQAHVWHRIQRNIRASEFTFPGDPMRVDYGYQRSDRNGARGFVQTLSVTRAPGDAKLLAHTVEHIRDKVKDSEFTAVTDVHLIAENQRHRFVQETLRETAIDVLPLEGFAVWVAKMKPVIQ